MQRAEKRLNTILKKARHFNITHESMENLKVFKTLCNVQEKKSYFYIITLIVIVLITCVFYSSNSVEVS